MCSWSAVSLHTYASVHPPLTLHDRYEHFDSGNHFLRNLTDMSDSDKDLTPRSKEMKTMKLNMATLMQAVTSLTATVSAMSTQLKEVVVNKLSPRQKESGSAKENEQATGGVAEPKHNISHGAPAYRDGVPGPGQKGHVKFGDVQNITRNFAERFKYASKKELFDMRHTLMDDAKMITEMHSQVYADYILKNGMMDAARLGKAPEPMQNEVKMLGKNNSSGIAVGEDSGGALHSGGGPE